MASLSHKEFLRRVRRIPIHGLGLSVDIHVPEVTSLLRSLQARQVPPEYFEVFYTEPAGLQAVREQVGQRFLAYHGEGLWITQPEMAGSWAGRQELDDAITHLQILQSEWLNHECATKYLAGYSYGTYLPPLYTRASAEIVAENAWQIQRLLDEQCALENGGVPLLLLEMPPLTYFVAGTLPIPTFFRLITELAPCGLVLDVGHLWTVFRYSGAYRTSSLETFVQAFLGEFPLNRVVEIHVAGLAIHESHVDTGLAQVRSGSNGVLPAWTDAHPAPIPPVLFEMLDQILAQPQLTNLKGMALEVDMKPEELIVEEFAQFTQRYSNSIRRMNVENRAASESEAISIERRVVSPADKLALREAYDRYARVVVGREEPNGNGVKAMRISTSWTSIGLPIFRMRFFIGVGRLRKCSPSPTEDSRRCMCHLQNLSHSGFGNHDDPSQGPMISSYSSLSDLWSLSARWPRRWKRLLCERLRCFDRAIVRPILLTESCR
jgi:uncharacterized protein